MTRIAIIGAGPAGLTLARILQNHGVEFTVFEKQHAAVEEWPATTLDIHVETGQRAIKESGLWDEFVKLARYDSEDFILVDKNNKTHLDLRGIDTGRPEIDRSQLRKIFLDALGPEAIQWGKTVVQVKNGTIYFTDGAESGFDLVVGADGAWSKVRTALTYIPPFYSGVSGLQLWISDINARYPELGEMVGRGSFFCHGDADEQSLFVQRNGDGSVRILAVGRRPVDWLEQTGFDLGGDAAATRALLRQQYSDWHPDLLRFIDASDDRIRPLVLYTLPPGLQWPHKHGVTLVGDAAHLMTPFSGQGVNVAMEDAVELAAAIIANPGSIDNATRSYEEQMFARAKRFTNIGWDALQGRWGAGTVQQLAMRFNKVLGSHKKTK